jgi:hypothetical protein
MQQIVAGQVIIRPTSNPTKQSDDILNTYAFV